MRLRRSTRERPRACIVRHAYYPDLHVRRDAETLVQAGYAVTVIALRRRGQPARELLNGVSVHRLPVEHRRGSAVRYAWEYLSFALLACLTVSMLHVRRRFQVVEVDNMPDILVLSAIVPRLTGTPVILYIFDQMPELFAHLRQVSARHPGVWLLVRLERLAAAVASEVIVTQEMARQVLIRRGVSPNKVTVILNAPDESIFVPEPVHPRRRRDGTFEVVTHGAILERYGIQTLLEALPHVVDRIPDVRVHVFGDGEYRPRLERLVQQFDIQERVTFHGLAPLEVLLDHLRRADVGYVGMLCDLMLSNKLVEYAVLGTPAIVARWPTYEHYFSDHEVRYFEPGEAQAVAEALIDVYQHPVEAAARAQCAAVRYQQYRWPEQREVYLALYDRLSRATQYPAGDPIHEAELLPR